MCCWSVTQPCPTLCNPKGLQHNRLPCLHYLPEFGQTHIHWVGDAIQHLIFCCPLLLLPSIFPSIRVFFNESVFLIRWPKYWSFSFSISVSKEYSGLISFRINWFDHLAVQGTLKSLLQHHSLKASIFQCLAFFMVQFSHLYMTTVVHVLFVRDYISSTIRTFVSKMMSLLFNTLARFVIAFLSRGKGF